MKDINSKEKKGHKKELRFFEWFKYSKKILLAKNKLSKPFD